MVRTANTKEKLLLKTEGEYKKYANEYQNTFQHYAPLSDMHSGNLNIKIS